MNSTFLSDFIMITNFKTIAFIIVLIAVLFGVNIMAKKKVKFSTRMIVCTIAGLILGIIISLLTLSSSFGFTSPFLLLSI